MATLSAIIGKDGYQELNQTNLQKAMDTQFGTGLATVVNNYDGTFTVKFKDRWYNINSTGSVERTINYELAMSKAKAQNVGGKIIYAIDSNGDNVNMNYWKFTLLEDGTYRLNTDEANEAGYIADENNDGIVDIKDGKIIGNIPRYIKTSTDENFKTVTDLTSTFRGLTELIETPKIPNTITNLSEAFIDCTNLTTVTELPDSIVNMRATFARCVNLENAPIIPLNVTNMQQTFLLTSISVAPSIPNKVENMRSTFQGTKIVMAPDIPNSVTNMIYTFYNCNLLTTASTIPNNVSSIRFTYENCPKLHGTIIINANITESSNCHGCLKNCCTEVGLSLNVSGNCPLLNEIVSSTNNSNISI